jgi:hypothetical protein
VPAVTWRPRSEEEKADGDGGSYFPLGLRKAFLRKAAERTIDGLNRSIGSFVRALTRSQCIEYFKHAGYKPV